MFYSNVIVLVYSYCYYSLLYLPKYEKRFAVREHNKKEGA